MQGHADKSLTTALTVAGWLLAGCAGGDFSFVEDYRGAAAFDTQSSAKLLLARPEGYRVRRIASPWEASEPLMEGSEALYGGGEAPRLYPEPNGARILVDGLSFAFGAGAGLFEITSGGPTEVNLDGTILDLHWGPDEPWVLHRAEDYTVRFTRGPANPGGTWETVAGTTDSNCVSAGTAIVVESDGDPVAFCGGKMMTLGTGADLVVNTSGTIAFSVAADGVRGPDGSAMFFFLAAGEGATTRLHRMTRDGFAATGWSSAELASMPGAPFEGSHRIVAASHTSLAVISQTCEEDEVGEMHCSGDLHAFWFDGSAWLSEPVTALADDDGLEGLTAIAEVNAPPRIMTGSIKLWMHSRDGASWVSEELGALGVQAEGPASCEVGGDLAPTALRVTLALLVLGPAVILLRRRR